MDNIKEMTDMTITENFPLSDCFQVTSALDCIISHLERSNILSLILTSKSIKETILTHVETKREAIREYFDLINCPITILNYVSKSIRRDNLYSEPTIKLIKQLANNRLTIVNENESGNVRHSLYWYKNGNMRKEIWIENKLRHKVGGPSIIEWYENGQLKKEAWYEYNECHRNEDDGPAWREWHENGNQKTEIWCFGGRYQRVNGPAYQEWDENGTKRKEIWFRFNTNYRAVGPAHQEWDENGNLILEEYQEDPSWEALKI